MRIWDLPPEELCHKHLLGEHRELHGLWNIITLGKTGYSRHPETRRWVGKQKALFHRHEAIVKDMQRRGYNNHKTPLDENLAVDQAVQTELIDSLEDQRQILRQKPCTCYQM